ncbi:CBS domain-containing protein [Myroides guanonis]|uniref:CBS domain-containing protein n=1 Tax=Myroides guanonis TaxID=1150112 RepID=A0A1I3U0X6_9FLAO|nr:CBS domain-containing protein [Myroides guanonis]SFJ76635.1 CBS domain-containing protein [Myroides guanonis]
MPRKEFIDLVNEIKKTGQSQKMSIRKFLWEFDYCEKRTSGNVWRINEFLDREKMMVVPNYQNGWIDEIIELKEKDKAKIKNGDSNNEEFDPISRLSVLEATSKTPISVKRDANLDKAFHLMWQNDFSQLPVMNDERNVLGIINWQTIAKGFIAKKDSNIVKDYMSNDFTVLDENTPLFEAIKDVIKYGVIFIKDSQQKIKGPVTTSDLNEEFIEQIEPFILLEQIENYIRLILNDKIVIEDLPKVISLEDQRCIESISDMTFGEYLRIMENEECWKVLNLPFDKSDFIKNLHSIRNIRNAVMHFHPDKISKQDLDSLRKTSKFLENFFMIK